MYKPGMYGVQHLDTWFKYNLRARSVTTHNPTPPYKWYFFEGGQNMLIIWSHDYSFSLCNMKKLLDVTRIVNSLVPFVQDLCMYYASSGRSWNRLSITVSSASVVMSPTLRSPIAIFRRILRMILPERVFGRLGASWTKSGIANGPIFVLTV